MDVLIMGRTPGGGPQGCYCRPISIFSMYSHIPQYTSTNFDIFDIFYIFSRLSIFCYVRRIDYLMIARECVECARDVSVCVDCVRAIAQRRYARTADREVEQQASRGSRIDWLLVNHARE